MRLTRMAAFLARRSWHRFAERTRLAKLPPVPSILAVLALGTLVPLAVTGKARPRELSLQLAVKRLIRFAERHATGAPEAGPQGPVFSPRPVLYWPAQPDAARYAVTLREGESVVIENRAVEGCYLPLRPPGTLDPGRSYRFEVRAFDAECGAVGTPLAHGFAIRRPPADLAALLDAVRAELGPADGALVLAGYFAERRSFHDVASALVAWKAARGEEADLRHGSPADWIAAEAAKLRRQEYGLREGRYNALIPLR